MIPGYGFDFEFPCKSAPNGYGIFREVGSGFRLDKPYFAIVVPMLIALERQVRAVSYVLHGWGELDLNR